MNRQQISTTNLLLKLNFEDNNLSDYSAPTFNVDSEDIDENPELKLTIDSEDDTEEFEMPNNINVLKRLISQLPSGVPRQTGAQIIRQTIEALGIPMKSVLQDAQRVRDCLNSSIKDCGYTIQEYKSNIKNLVRKYCSFMPYNIYVAYKGDGKDEPMNTTVPLYMKNPKDCTDAITKSSIRILLWIITNPFSGFISIWIIL